MTCPLSTLGPGWPCTLIYSEAHTPEDVEEGWKSLAATHSHFISEALRDCHVGPAALCSQPQPVHPIADTVSLDNVAQKQPDRVTYRRSQKPCKIRVCHSFPIYVYLCVSVYVHMCAGTCMCAVIHAHDPRGWGATSLSFLRHHPL